MSRWRARHNRKRSGKSASLRHWWSWWRTPIFVLLLAGVWWMTQKQEPPGEWVKIGQTFGVCGERGRPYACVSDGDTVTLGYGRQARRIRLTGFDTPEMDGACAAESATARVAQSALRDWLNSGLFEWNGGADPNYDKYGRELRAVRRVQADGSTQELADVMIDAKLAEGDGPWESRDWCR